MRRRLGALVIVLVLSAPAAGIAASTPRQSPFPDVFYLLRGKLSHFVAPHGSANGSVTITVSSDNRAAATAVGKTLTLLLTPSTHIVYDADGEISDGETGLVRIMGGVRPLPPRALQTVPVNLLIDLGRASS